VELATAHGALVHTTRGDVSQFSLTEIQNLAGRHCTPAMAR
jgi:hypothetical protein